MGGIPILSDIVDAIQNAVGWVWTNSPDWLKLCIFLAIFTFTITWIFLPVFDALGWGHRILQPAVCAGSYAVAVSNVNFSASEYGMCNASTGVCPYLDACQSAASCILLQSNSSCSCTCGPYYQITPNCSFLDQILGLCGLEAAPNVTRLSCSGCSGFSINQRIGWLQICSSNTANMSTQFIALQQTAGCANTGIDILNPAFYLILTISIPLGKLALWFYTASGVMRPPIH